MKSSQGQKAPSKQGRAERGNSPGIYLISGCSTAKVTTALWYREGKGQTSALKAPESHTKGLGWYQGGEAALDRDPAQ